MVGGGYEKWGQGVIMQTGDRGGPGGGDVLGMCGGHEGPRMTGTEV